MVTPGSFFVPLDDMVTKNYHYNRSSHTLEVAKMVRSYVVALVAGLMAFSLAASARAAPNLIFYLGDAFNTGYLNTGPPSSSGVGQGVTVSYPTTITNMEFYFNMPDGGDAKFLIYQGDSSLNLFSTSEAVPASSTKDWITSPSFDFALTPGDTYDFALVTNALTYVGYLNAPAPYQDNELIAITTGNSTYHGFQYPISSGDGNAEIGLALFGTVAPPPVPAAPEPSTWALMLTGLAIIGGALRQSHRRNNFLRVT